MPYHAAILCHTIPYHAMPYYMAYHTIPYHTIPYHTIPYHTIPYHTIPYHTMHRTKKRISIKFALCKYVASMSFAQLCTQCKCGDGRIYPFLCEFGHRHLCTGCKALRISYLQHICSRQIWGKFDFSSSAIPYHTIPYHTIPYHTIPYHTIPYHTIPYHARPYGIPYRTVPYRAVPYHTMPCYAMPCHTILTLFLTGSYIYIEASAPRVKGDKAAIEAGPFKPNQNFCFTFYYHMFGIHIGRLSVYRTWFNRTNVRLLWSRNTSSGNYWQASSLDVRSTEEFYVSDSW